MVKKLLKPATTALLLISYLFLSSAVSLLPATGRRRRRMRIRLTSFFSGAALASFGIRVRVNGVLPLQPAPGGRLIVSNHLSYLDVLTISSLIPSVFITSVELKSSFLLGALARFGGCLFVERRKPSGLKQEIADIASALGQGFPVVLFPEGTTSNGEGVGQFKNSLFDAAASTGAGILPLCLRYRSINGEAVAGHNRDLIFYYGDATFLRHLCGLLSLESIDVDIKPLKTITVTAKDSRKELAAEAHTAISAAYRD